MREIQIGRIYRHFKGNFYLAEAVAKDADSGEDCVIYRKLYGDGGLWVRSLEEFLSPMRCRNSGLSCRRFQAERKPKK